MGCLCGRAVNGGRLGAYRNLSWGSETKSGGSGKASTGDDIQAEKNREGRPDSGAALAKPTGIRAWWGRDEPLGRACGWREHCWRGKQDTAWKVLKPYWEFRLSPESNGQELHNCKFGGENQAAFFSSLSVFLRLFHWRIITTL